MALFLKQVGPNKVSVVRVYREETGAGLKDAMDAVDRVAISPVEIFPLQTEAGTEQIMDKFFAVGAKVEEIYNEDLGSRFDKVVSDQDGSEDAHSSDQKKCNTSEGSDSREETLKNLVEAGKTAKILEDLTSERENLIYKIAVSKSKVEEIRSQVSVEAKKKMWTLPIVVCVLFIWFWGIGLILAVILYIARKKKIVAKDLELHKEENERKEQAYIEENVEPLETRKNEVDENLTELKTSGKIEWAIDYVGKDMFEYQKIAELYNLVKSKRADSLKEALNLYDSAQHNIRMEDMQAAIQNAAEIQAVEAAKQTAYSKEIAKNTHKTATAAQASAYHTRQIDKNTRRFR